MNKKKDEIIIENIPLKGSLGLLAYGDIAFKQWREVKIAHNIFQREKEEKLK